MSTTALTIEMKDNTAETFDEAIGLATYCNSESTVSSYLSIQSEIYEQKERIKNK